MTTTTNTNARNTSTITLFEARALLQAVFQPHLWVDQEQKESNLVFNSAVEAIVWFPELAREKFEFGSTAVLPFSLLLLSKSQLSLSIVRQIYSLYPPSVNGYGLYFNYSAGVRGKLSRPDFNFYPLYLACCLDLESSSCQDTQEIIQFIASQLEDHQYYPESLATFRRLFQINPKKGGQKHLSLQTTKILLTKYPDLTTVEYSEGKILDVAFQNEYSIEILKYILRRTPQRSMSIRAPSSIQPERLILLKEHLLPNITQLHWLTHSLEGLGILRNCLATNTAITKLTLGIRAGVETGEKNILQETTQQLLTADNLQSLSIETTSSTLDIMIQPLCEALQNNCNLHTLTLDPPISDLKPMNALLKVLEGEGGGQNIGLHNVSIDQRLHKYSSHKKILYYLLLNQSGRALARNPQTPIEEFLQLLHDVTHNQGKMHQHRLLYGLLRETPSLWCGQQGCSAEQGK